MGGGASLLAGDSHGVDFSAFQSMYSCLTTTGIAAETLFDMYKDTSDLVPMSKLVELNQIRDVLLLSMSEIVGVGNGNSNTAATAGTAKASQIMIFLLSYPLIYTFIDYHRQG